MVNETTIFYLDIASKFVKKKDITKALEIYINETKKKTNINFRFSLFYFNNTSDPIFVPDLPDIKTLDKKLDEEWKDRKVSDSNMENGLFFCVSELAAQAQKAEGSYRVIVLSDIPSNKDAAYVEALLNLVESVRNFPTFIDIIRIGKERLYKDDVKLRLISTITSGGLFYVDSPKSLNSVMLGLVKNKILPDLGVEGGQIIDSERKKYWVNLAVSMVPAQGNNSLVCDICKQTVCSYCNSNEDVPLLCPNCGTTYHECCAALYSFKHNVGLKHIFRCAKCSLLIKMDERTVFAINEVPFEDELSDVQEEIVEEDEEAWTPPSEEVEYNQEAEYIKPIEELPNNMPPTIGINQNQPEQNKPVMRVGLFGQKIPIKQEKSPIEEQKPVEPIAQPNTTTPESKESALERRKRRREEAGGDQVILCSVCSKYVKKNPNMHTCPNCNSPLF